MQLEVSDETIYRHVYVDRSLGGDLYRHLRYKKKRQRYEDVVTDRRGQIIGCRAILEHPANVEIRSQIGNWEDDMLIAKAISR